jgi:hypothetical protein
VLNSKKNLRCQKSISVKGCTAIAKKTSKKKLEVVYKGGTFAPQQRISS